VVVSSAHHEMNPFLLKEPEMHNICRKSMKHRNPKPIDIFFWLRPCLCVGLFCTFVGLYVSFGR